MGNRLFAVRAVGIPEFDVKSLSEISGRKSVSVTLNVHGSANLRQKFKCMDLFHDLLYGSFRGQEGAFPFLSIFGGAGHACSQ